MLQLLQFHLCLLRIHNLWMWIECDIQQLVFEFSRGLQKVTLVLTDVSLLWCGSHCEKCTMATCRMIQRNLVWDNNAESIQRKAQIAKCICPNCKIYLSKILNVFVQIAKCICPNCRKAKAGWSKETWFETTMPGPFRKKSKLQDKNV